MRGTPRAWHRHSPFPWPTRPGGAPDLAHHQEWTMGMQRPKLEGGLWQLLRLRGKGTKRNER